MNISKWIERTDRLMALSAQRKALKSVRKSLYHLIAIPYVKGTMADCDYKDILEHIDTIGVILRRNEEERRKL
jgi:hypothetical protein